MDVTQPTERRSAAGTSTMALVVLLLLCASAAVTACGAASTTTSDSPSVAPSLVAASVAASPSAAPLPKGAGRGTIAFTKVTLTTVAYEEGPAVPPFDVYVVRSDGTGLKRLAANAQGPAWSPDGSKIAYTSLSARGGVWVMNADGSGKRRVTPAPGGAEWVAWSPDGRQILFSSTAFGGAAALGGADTLAVVDSDGSGLESVFADTSRGSGVRAALSPGRRTGGSSSAGGAGAWARSARSIPAAASSPSSLPPRSRQASRSHGTASGSRSGMGTQTACCAWRPAAGGWRSCSWRRCRSTRVGAACRPGHRTAASSCSAGTHGDGWWPGSVLHVAKTDGSEVWEVPNTAGAYDPAWRPE